MSDAALAVQVFEDGDPAGAESLLEGLPPCDPGSDEQADRLELRGRIATWRRDREGGMKLLEEALALRQQLHGKTGEHAARGLAAVANHLLMFGDGEQAARWAARAVKMSDDPRWLVVRGDCERVAGDMAAAELTYKRALGKLRGAERMTALRGLGNVHRMQGNARAARKRLREALELVEDRRTYDGATLLSGIGAATADLGEHEDGVARLEEALEILVEVCGELHADVAVCLNNLGLALSEIDTFRAAAALQYSVAVGEHVFPDHPSQGTAFANLAYLASEAGRPAAAIAYNERGLAIQERLLGPTHIQVLLAQSNMAHYEQERGRDDLALSRARNLAVHLAALVAAEQEPAAGVLHSTGQLLLELDRDVARAVELFTASFDMRVRLRRKDDEVILNTARNIAARLFVAGAVDEAVAFLHHARASCKDADFKAALADKLTAVRAGDRATVVEDTELD